MRLRAPLFFAASLALLTLSSAAGAQQAPPDVVKLRDGSMYRGTISELVANDHVDLMTANGQTRRFAMKDVAFAGSATAPEPSAPPPPPPPPPPPGEGSMITVNAQRAEMRFEANEPDVQFQLRTGQSEMAGVGWGWRSTYSFAAQTSSYTTICTAPCSGSLPTGTHRIGLSHNGRTVIEPEDPTVITGSGTLRGTYTSHTGLRVAGLLVDIASVAVVGTVLMLQRDTADISFVPMAPMASSGSKEMAALRVPGLQPQGMALQLRF